MHRARRNTNASKVVGQKTTKSEVADTVPPCTKETLEEGLDAVLDSTIEQDTTCADDHLVGAIRRSLFEALRGREEASIEVDVIGGLQSGPSFSLGKYRTPRAGKFPMWGHPKEWMRCLEIFLPVWKRTLISMLQSFSKRPQNSKNR